MNASVRLAPCISEIGLHDMLRLRQLVAAGLRWRSTVHVWAAKGTRSSLAVFEKTPCCRRRHRVAPERGEVAIADVPPQQTAASSATERPSSLISGTLLCGSGRGGADRMHDTYDTIRAYARRRFRYDDIHRPLSRKPPQLHVQRHSVTAQVPTPTTVQARKRR